MRFEISFHTPFRVATGRARPGVDIAVDEQNALPGSSLKGVMRAAASSIFPGKADLVAEVFGTARGASPWSWSRARFASLSRRPRARVAIDPTTFTAEEEALFVAEELWSARADFEVLQIGRVADERLHGLVLRASAQAVHALGGDRRRGLGWVSIRCLDPALDAAEMDDIISLASGNVARA